MKDEEHWNRFASSGRVADYLEYCRNVSDYSDSGRTYSDEREDMHGGNSYAYRDDTDIVPDERI